MNIGHVREYLDNGRLMARKGWNGKGMYIEKVSFVAETDPLKFGHNRSPFTQMKTATGEFNVWTCSTADFYADDWVEVDKDGNILTYADGRTAVTGG